MWKEEGAVEIGRRLADAMDDAYPDARQAIQTFIVQVMVNESVELINSI